MGDAKDDSIKYQLDFAGGEAICMQISPMKGSYHIYLTTPQGNVAMKNLVCAIQTPYDSMPSATTLIPSHDAISDSWATSVGQKLAKRLKVQMFVSCNLPDSYESIVPQMELEILKLVSAHVESKQERAEED